MGADSLVLKLNVHKSIKHPFYVAVLINKAVSPGIQNHRALQEFGVHTAAAAGAGGNAGKAVLGGKVGGAELVAAGSPVLLATCSA